ncbi:ubiquitin carboxyl-terminal hydrolase 27 [Citrus sinensis]|uniref:Ubiquitin carboxyl-terminal hydrolase 27 n=3 Tax=Citrus sinensis TaxID=2711 RepID=A0ACB8JJF8_CITSI|nr:ubiquitin carboxyl-terminal hydrolase 27 [Citrus sinensis]
MKCEGATSVRALVLQSLKNGFLPHMKWVSASGLLGILGVAGFVLALKKDAKIGNLSGFSWLSEKENRLEKLCLVPGLQNLGNNCFLNVILQALASCTCFLPFLQKVMGECEEPDEDLPLTVALASLLEELCLVGETRLVLSPQKVMLAMELYIQNFNLTSQQDAEEAFLHLMSSLREEFLESYSPNESSLVDAFEAASCRILSLKRREVQSEQKRWRKHFFGPFDGILGSILTCQSCLSQISLDYQFFHSLPLSPMLDSGSTIPFGCTLEDCLKQFLTAEQLENYHCSHCWHIAAIKYLSITEANEMEIEELRRCSAQDSCNCRSRLHLETLPWSNKFSHTLKKLSISHCPQGHIAFPLILDLFPFVKSGVGINDLDESWQRGQAKVLNERPSSSLNHVNRKYDAKVLNSIYGLMGKNNHTKALGVDELGCTAHEKEFRGESILPPTQSGSNVRGTDIQMQPDDEVIGSSQLCQPNTYLYRLASVVEHFGRVGSGHYTVYRSVRVESHEENPNEHFETPLTHWFCISDSQVYSVSVNDVLAAEASLLFYERIIES